MSIKIAFLAFGNLILNNNLLYFGAIMIALGISTLMYQRIQLSRAKHRSLSGHSRIAKKLTKIFPGYHFDDDMFFKCDKAPKEIENSRRAAFYKISDTLNSRHPLTLEVSMHSRDDISDMQFVSAYRVPFQFSPFVQKHLKIGSYVDSASGVQIKDLDGQTFFDLTGSYGVNLFGADFYKKTMSQGLMDSINLGSTLGVYHLNVAKNAELLKKISNKDEISFHMSGTEAVMQAVRISRYHTRRKYIVRFCGAYHGWWEDVQPGPGNPMPPRETYTLSDLSDRSLEVIRTRKDIACVLVNPIQALHPNANAPSDNTLVDSSRHANYDKQAYTKWLHALRKACSDNGVVLIFDEVFLGFRLAPGGAQEYFNVQADLVTYGKTLGGGFPVGVVCGKKELMKRFYMERPADICFARGTFKEHPTVMGAMAAFLDQLETPEIKAMYEGNEDRWNQRCKIFNETMMVNDLPVRCANMSSVWTVFYTQPSRYNWMLQYYLRVNGLALSWIGTGRLIFSLNYTDDDFKAVLNIFLKSCQEMKEDGWWWHNKTMTNKNIRRAIVKETFFSSLSR
jgi:glutamate-1-semialdehyde 2,1-aminomutase